MAKEIQIAYTSTAVTMYAIVRNSTGSVWDTTGSSFVAYATADITKYDIALSEQGTASRYYAGDMPALSAGVYNVAVYQRAGASPDENDTLAGVAQIHWDGSAVSAIPSVAAIQSGLATSTALSTLTGYFAIRTGTAQAGAGTSITLDASASATTDLYAGTWVLITGGTGVGQPRLITAYNGTTKVATVNPAWATNPDGTSTFVVLTAAYLAGVKGNVDGNVTGNVAGNVTGSVGSIAADGIVSTSLAASATNAIADSILDRSAGIETGYTLRQSLRLVLSACAAKISGAGTGTVTIRDIGDTKDRIVATTTAAGNRTAITIDVS